MFSRSNLLWLLGIVLLVAYVSTILKVTETFRSSRKKKSKKSKKSKKNKIINQPNQLTPSKQPKEFKKKMLNNILRIKKDNVSIPNDVSVEFGANISGKEVNAGKIRYGGWDGGVLNIVGEGDNGVNRKVRVWDKLQVGPLEVQEDGCIGYGPDKKYRFCFQTDGNIVQYKDKKPVWATGVPS